MSILSWLNGRLSGVEKVFLLFSAVAGVVFAAYGQDYFTNLYTATTSANYFNFLASYYLLDPLAALITVVGYFKFGGVRGALAFFFTTVAYDLLFYKGVGTASDVLLKYAPQLNVSVFGVSFGNAFYGYVLPLSILLAVALFIPKVFDEAFGTKYVS